MSKLVKLKHTISCVFDTRRLTLHMTTVGLVVFCEVCPPVAGSDETDVLEELRPLQFNVQELLLRCNVLFTAQPFLKSRTPQTHMKRSAE